MLRSGERLERRHQRSHRDCSLTKLARIGVKKSNTRAFCFPKFSSFFRLKEESATSLLLSSFLFLRRRPTAVAFFPTRFSSFLSLSRSRHRPCSTPRVSLEMGVVFSSLWHWMFPGKEYKIVMVRKRSGKRKQEDGNDDDHR